MQVSKARKPAKNVQSLQNLKVRLKGQKDVRKLLNQASNDNDESGLDI